MKTLPVAGQGYSVRDDAERDFKGTMQKIKDMGFRATSLTDELEAMKDALVPYMSDYGIFSLDADEMTNKVRIEVYERSPALEQPLENDADSYEIVGVGDIQVDDLLLSAEEHQAVLAQGEAPYNWESESSQVS